MTNTNDLSKFGLKELSEAGKLLSAYSDGNQTQRVTDFFGYSGVKVEFNPDSGNVFLVDDDYNVAMMDSEGVLDLWLFTPYNGQEGFFDDLKDEYDTMHKEDKEYLRTYDTNKELPQETGVEE